MGNRGSDAVRRRLKRQLWKRDEPICYYCLLPLDPQKRYPDDWSVEIDEVVPASLGGSTTDIDNLRLVHRCCNIRRSNRVDDEVEPGFLHDWAVNRLISGQKRSRIHNSRLW